VRQVWVDRATEALSNFGAVTRTEAQKLLIMWTHYSKLSKAEEVQVLRNFL
jgi:hypothetical protein